MIDGTYRVRPDLTLEPVHETAGFWVATSPSYTTQDTPTRDTLREALIRLAEPEFLGVWTDPDTQTVYFDAPVHIVDRDTAIRTGQAHNQIAIWDCANNTSIATGGDGS